LHALGLLLARVREDIRQKRDTKAWVRACFTLEKGEDVSVSIQVRATLASASLSDMFSGPIGWQVLAFSASDTA
jgi:hypothetical protein